MQKISLNFKRTPHLQSCLSILFLLLSLFPYAVWSDRIYHKDRGLLRGRIIEYGPNYYKLERSNGSNYIGVEKIEHDDIEEVAFSQSRSERGYDGFFTRLSLGAGLSSYELELQGEFLASQGNPDATEPLVVDFPPSARLAFEAGFMIWPYYFALHSGLDHTHVNFHDDTQPSYFYQTLCTTLSHYLPFYNLYISLQARYVLAGSFLYRALYAFGSQTLADIDFPIEAEGVGYGVTLGKEWYVTSWLVWGLALTYTSDSLKRPDKVFGKGVNQYNIIVASENLEYIGFALTIAYD